MPTSPPKRVALVTGASSGVGAAAAIAFARAGFDVLISGRDAQRLSRVREQIDTVASCRCESFQADFSTRQGLAALDAFMRDRSIDVVVNNAAVNPELTDRRSVSDLSDIAGILSVNTAAAIAVCYSAFECFKARRSGTIVNVNSIAGLRGSTHEPVYAASKFGLRGFSESVKDAWLAQGVRLTDVYVGAIATGMSSARADMAELIDPQELANFVVGLCGTNTFYVRDVNLQKTPLSVRRPKKVVFANGVFDLLHPGHIALLSFAKSIGDKLIVGLNSDQSVRMLKGPLRPVQDEQTRKGALERLGFIDEVVIFDGLRTTDLVRRLRPDVVVKGDEYTAEAIRSADQIAAGVEIVTFPVLRDQKGVKFSTSSLIDKSAEGEVTC